MAFDNKSIKPVRFKKPHIVKRAGLWRVSPYDHKRLWRDQIGGLWVQAHVFTNRLNVYIMQDAEEAKERQREYKRKQNEVLQ